MVGMSIPMRSRWLVLPTFAAALYFLLLDPRTARTDTAICGDTTIGVGETCDDGNTSNGDGCSASCQVEDQCYDAGNTFSFFLWSDSYGSAGDSGVMRLMADAVDRIRYPERVIPRFWISTGDIPFMGVSPSYLDELNDTISNSPWGSSYPFSCPASNGKFPYFVAIGNHDIDGSFATSPQSQYNYWRSVVGPKLSSTLVGITNFQVGPNNGYDSLTNYSFDYKNAHFVVVNQYYADPEFPTSDPVACVRPTLYQWIDQDLAQSSKPMKFVFGHEPAWSYCSNAPGYGGDFCPPTDQDNQTPGSRVRPYSTMGDWTQPFGEHWGDSLEDAHCPIGSREAFWSMLASHNVVAHFAGHSHTYSGRLVQGDGVRRNDVTAYSKTGETHSAAEGVWEVNTGQVHNSAGAAYVLVTVRNDVVTFEGYDQLSNGEEPFRQIESWNVSLSGTFNRPPVLAPIPNQSIGAQQTLTFTASAVDPDAGQILSYSLMGAPSGAVIDSVTGVFSWTPTLAQFGTFNFSVKAMDDGSPPASASRPVVVTVSAPPPDLIETSVATSATAVLPGGTISVTDTVSNQGANARSFVVGFHLSGDTAYGGSDDVAFSTTRSVSSLAASATSTGSKTLTVPKSASLGDYHVCAAADSTNTVTEASETNNSLCTVSTIRVTRPDLVMTDVQPGAASIRAKGTATLPVTDTVKNLESLAAASFKIAYRLSTNQTYGDAGDITISVTRSVGALAGGASNQGTAKLAIPDNTAPGNYYVCAKADSADSITELSENNNAICTATTVRVDP
jgi:cysteine-rich repeat protein